MYCAQAASAGCPAFKAWRWAGRQGNSSGGGCSGGKPPTCEMLAGAEPKRGRRSLTNAAGEEGSAAARGNTQSRESLQALAGSPGRAHGIEEAAAVIRGQETLHRQLELA